MGTNPSKSQGCSKPVGGIRWFDAVEFCNRLSTLKGRTPYYEIVKEELIYRGDPTANGFRLPTETEWEWAAKGGEDFFFAGSNKYSDVGWEIELGVEYQSYVVGQKKGNGYGLYDMTGNVEEWCWDWSPALANDFYQHTSRYLTIPDTLRASQLWSSEYRLFNTCTLQVSDLQLSKSNLYKILRLAGLSASGSKRDLEERIQQNLSESESLFSILYAVCGCSRIVRGSKTIYNRGSCRPGYARNRSGFRLCRN